MLLAEFENHEVNNPLNWPTLPSRAPDVDGRILGSVLCQEIRHMAFADARVAAFHNGATQVPP
jgi:hypothetical protein